jgi:hypothetical protein
MAMNSSGPISLGGATTGQSINLEVGAPATSTVSLNDTIVRTLAGVATGQIVVPTDFYGKSLSSGYFQIITSPATPLWNQRMLADTSTNTFYFQSYPGNVTSTTSMIARSDTSGNILFATRYTPSTNSWSLDGLNLSNFNSNYLAAANNARATSTNSPPVNSFGKQFMYIDKTNGSIISTGARNVNFVDTVIDFPGGNYIMTTSSPPGFSTNYFFNSSNTYLAQAALTLNQSAPAGSRGSSGAFHNLNNPTNVNILGNRPTPVGGGFTSFNISNTGGLTSGLAFATPSPGVGQSVATNPTFRYVGTGLTSGPVPAGIYKLDRSSNSVTSSIVTPGTSASTGLFGSALTTNTDTSGNFCLIRPSNVGTNTLNFMTSSLGNPSAYVITSPTTPTATFIPNFYLDGYLYIAGQYAPNVIGILKIKEDGSNLGAGITASVGGYSIALTQNPSGLISSTPAGAFTGSSWVISPTQSTITPQTAISNSSTPAPITQSKVSV